MSKFMLFVAAAAVCAPLAAYATGTASPVSNAMPVVKVTAQNSNDLSYQVAHLNGEVVVLDNEVQALAQQNTANFNEAPELQGVIPSGG